MLRLSGLRLRERCDITGLRCVAAEVLGVCEDSVSVLSIYKLSIDARRKPDVRFVYTLIVKTDDESAILEKNLSNVSLYAQPEQYVFPAVGGAASERMPVVVGTGPAGLFAALSLAEAGLKCIVLERGPPVEQRIEDVSLFWRSGKLDESSNVQFGEGGAGTFSDGKLTTGIGDKRLRYVLERLVGFGAPDDILYLSKPHIGTDKLCSVIKAARARLIELGCDIRFGHMLADIGVSGGVLNSVTIDCADGLYSLATDTLILAPGNSARDTFEMLSHRGVILSPKDFSVGLRIEHLQRDINEAQYGLTAVSAGAGLPATDYKLVVHLAGGRSVYTFCVCPGGQVVAAASEQGGVVTNGMSRYARDGENCNGALLVNVTPEDFGFDPLDGLEFQRMLERAAFEGGGGNGFAPVQLVGDFLKKRASTGCDGVSPTYSPGVRYCNLWDFLPEFMCEAISEALTVFSRRVSGFAHPEAVLTAVETRSSSPVRIVRENYEAVGIRGIFPCGEGAGYAGGIMSSAIDGIRCAERIADAIR